MKKITLAIFALSSLVSAANLKQADLLYSLQREKSIVRYVKDAVSDYENTTWLYPALVTGKASIFTVTVSRKPGPEIYVTFLAETGNFNKAPYINEITIYYDKKDAGDPILIEKLANITKTSSLLCLGLSSNDATKLLDWTKKSLTKRGNSSDEDLYTSFNPVEVDLGTIQDDPNTFYLSILNTKNVPGQGAWQSDSYCPLR